MTCEYDLILLLTAAYCLLVIYLCLYWSRVQLMSENSVLSLMSAVILDDF